MPLLDRLNQAITTSVPSLVRRITQSFEPVGGQVRARDVLREVPGAAANMMFGNTAKIVGTMGGQFFGESQRMLTGKTPQYLKNANRSSRELFGTPEKAVMNTAGAVSELAPWILAAMPAATRAAIASTSPTTYRSPTGREEAHALAKYQTPRPTEASLPFRTVEGLERSPVDIAANALKQNGVPQLRRYGLDQAAEKLSHLNSKQLSSVDDVVAYAKGLVKTQAEKEVLDPWITSALQEAKYQELLRQGLSKVAAMDKMESFASLYHDGVFGTLRGGIHAKPVRELSAIAQEMAGR